MSSFNFWELIPDSNSVDFIHFSGFDQFVGLLCCQGPPPNGLAAVVVLADLFGRPEDAVASVGLQPEVCAFSRSGFCFDDFSDFVGIHFFCGLSSGSSSQHFNTKPIAGLRKEKMHYFFDCFPTRQDQRVTRAQKNPARRNGLGEPPPPPTLKQI